MIGGFIITGNAPKKVVVRGIGPSTGMATALADPVLDLYQPDGSVVTNDNWQQASNAGDLPPSLQPKDPRESAILITLAPGLYTSVVHGKGGATGIALVEVYDLSAGAASRVVNISTRGFVQAGYNCLIGGFILSGNIDTTAEVVLRVIGPSLANWKVLNPLADPFLDVRDGNGNPVASNNNWKDDPNAARVSQLGLAPQNELESALDLVLSPGNYTAIASSNSGSSGVGLVEVYAITGGSEVRQQ